VRWLPRSSAWREATRLARVPWPRSRIRQPRRRLSSCVPFGTRNHFARRHRPRPQTTPLVSTRSVQRRRRASGRRRPRERPPLHEQRLARRVRRARAPAEQHRRRDEAFARVRGLLAVAQNRHRLRVRVNGEELVARVLLVGNNRTRAPLHARCERERLDPRRAPALGGARRCSRPPGRSGSTPAHDRARRRCGAGGDRRRPVVLGPALELESLPGALRSTPAGCARIGPDASAPPLPRITSSHGSSCSPGVCRRDARRSRQRMDRQEVAPGTAIVREGDVGRSASTCLLAGMLSRLEQARWGSGPCCGLATTSARCRSR